MLSGGVITWMAIRFNLLVLVLDMKASLVECIMCEVSRSLCIAVGRLPLRLLYHRASKILGVCLLSFI